MNSNVMANNIVYEHICYMEVSIDSYLIQMQVKLSKTLIEKGNITESILRISQREIYAVTHLRHSMQKVTYE